MGRWTKQLENLRLLVHMENCLVSCAQGKVLSAHIWVPTIGHLVYGYQRSVFHYTVYLNRSAFKASTSRADKRP